MSPTIDRVAEQYGDRLKVVKMEVDLNPEAVAQCNVQGVPALILFKNGEKVEAVEGAINRQKLDGILTSHLSA